MFYSEELVEEIRERNDIVEVIGSYVKLQRKGNAYMGLCPFHNEKSASFSVSPQKQMYHCFGCGAGGNVFTFIMEYENDSFPEAVEFLANRAGIRLPEREYSREERQQQDLRARILELNKLAAKYFYYQLRNENGAHAMRYLQKRQISAETMRNFGLGFAPQYSNDLYKYLKGKQVSDELLKESGLMNVDEKHGMYDKFWNRVIFPIMDVNNRVIGFGGRVMGNGKPKYLNSPETKVFDKSRNLYGMNIARLSRKKQILVCEGYMDVISLHQAGFTNAVASLGTALTEKHAVLLKRYTDEVILTYDSDQAGVRAALRAIPIVKHAGLKAKVLHMEPYKDPDEFMKALGAEAFQKRIDSAESSFSFELSVLEQEYDMEDPESKTAFFQAVAEKLVQFDQELERENYLEAAAKRYQISAKSLREIVGRKAMQAIGREVPAVRVRETGKKEKDSSIKKSQRLMLTWIIERKDLYEKVKPYLSAEDFTEDLYREVAALLFAQMERGEWKPAQIISHFTDPAQQSEASALFQTRLELEGERELEKAFNETLRRILRNRIARDKEALPSTDIEGLQRLMEERKKVQELYIPIK